MASGNAEDAFNIDDIYAVLGNPIKRRIVEILAERGAVSFTELKRNLNLSVGALYYNLDGLKDFVTKDEVRRYVLTEKGLKLYRAMKEGDEAIKRALEPEKGALKLLDSLVIRYLVPQNLMIPLYRNNMLSLVVALSCMLLGLSATLFTRLPLKVLEVEQVPLLYPRKVGSIVVDPHLLILTNYAVSLLLAMVFIQLAARLFTRNKPPLLGLLAGLLAAQLPLYAYMLVQWVVSGWSYPDVPVQTMIALALAFRSLQVVSICLLTAVVSVFYRISRERGFLIVFLLLYFSFFIKAAIPG